MMDSLKLRLHYHQNESRPTKRALDGWDSAAFSSIFLASGLYCSQAFVHARPPASNANRWAVRDNGSNFIRTNLIRGEK
jgi:hypothetical protein